MSYPYPQDRNRDRREKGEQPYKEAKEAFAQTESDLQRDAEAFGEAEQRERAETLRNASAADRKQLLEAEMSDQLEETNQEMMSKLDAPTGRPSSSSS